MLHCQELRRTKDKNPEDLNEKETIEKAFTRISDIIECNNGVREADYIGIVSKACNISKQALYYQLRYQQQYVTNSVDTPT